MPRVISVNNHRFPGPNQYYAGPPTPTGASSSTWVPVSTGVLIIAFPAYNFVGSSPGIGYRYDITTNTTTAESYAYGTYPNLAGGGVNAQFRKGYFCSLGGGFALVGRIDTSSGTSIAWIYNDQTRSFTSINGPGFILSSGSSSLAVGAYHLGPNLAYVEHNGQAFVYNRINNTWTSAATITSVWTGARISDGLLYLAGKKNESAPNATTYTADSAESWIYNHSTNTVTALGHSLQLKFPPTEGIGGSSYLRTKSGQMANFANDGIIALGANNNWLVYRHSIGTIITRPATYIPQYIALLRSNPVSYVLDRAVDPSTNYVYSW